jgi:hypothetical protein
MDEVKMKRKLFNTLSMTLLASITASCSIFAPISKNVRFNSKNAQYVEVDGNSYGLPAVVKVNKWFGCDYVFIPKKGYAEAAGSVGSHPSSLFFIDFVAGWFWLVPWIGCITPGGWELETTNVHPHLYKLEN